MRKFNKSNIMKRAWELYRLYGSKLKKFSRKFFAQMLRDAWQDARWNTGDVAQVKLPTKADIQKLMIVTKECLTAADYTALKSIRNAA